ncbi:DUF732 domain-containing protein [Mycobacterium bourgelatii]|uniref:DUF732 domain-containing protein n=1 Tax=Mycobacterium bourgelatii TaxID=1273442 RepID=A0A7I9YQC2_MYCBU|nr:DUF732 domain-containing protein [Mycobacterium bourgelatii]MCV6973715.1 DUF732 domain-containing protein [Mycobacterium bourgelatii]GFG90673.1 hypothetical protein MBOU_27150 [Mycobacterium bourgelatii]
MKGLIALIGICAAIGIAAPAYADPDNGPGGDDAGFLAALQHADIGYRNPAQAIGSAKAVCTCLNSGESGLELVHDVQTHNPAFNMDAAAEFAVLSSKYYCPQHLSKN